MKMYEVDVRPRVSGSVLKPHVRRVRATDMHQAAEEVARAMVPGYRIWAVTEVAAPREIVAAWERKHR